MEHASATLLFSRPRPACFIGFPRETETRHEGNERVWCELPHSAHADETLSFKSLPFSDMHPRGWSLVLALSSSACVEHAKPTKLARRDVLVQRVTVRTVAQVAGSHAERAR